MLQERSRLHRALARGVEIATVIVVLARGKHRQTLRFNNTAQKEGDVPELGFEKRLKQLCVSPLELPNTVTSLWTEKHCCISVFSVRQNQDNTQQ